jgi:outer membrane receptor protein involved in Fe transport
VGVTVDDVPYGASSALPGGNFVPDIDPSELARIEVLRGPQGTLYGASSIGGLLKFVTIDPSTDSISGHVQADGNGVEHGDGAGYGVRGTVNLPVGDTLAARASGFKRRDAGYVDDPILHLSGINQVDVYGGRFSALWRPSAAFSAKLSAFLQNTTGEGSSSINTNELLQPTLGDLQQSQVRGTGRYSQRVTIYSAAINARLGTTDLTAISGYGISKYSNSADNSATLGFAADLLFGVAGSALNQVFETKKFTQEIRWSSLNGQPLEWLVGAFYTHEDSPTEATGLAVDPVTGASAGTTFTDPFPTTYAEYAAFLDLTWHITRRFDIQVGGRESQNKQSYMESIAGPIIPVVYLVPSPLLIPPVHTKDNSFTYLLTPRFKLSPDLMIYARLASGYRPGGPNPTSTLYHLPTHYEPDKTVNVELGFKGTALERLISFDTSVYYIDWKNIQLQVSDASTGVTFYTNSSRAKSEGVEVSAQSTPVKGLTVGAWVALNNAVLTADFPATSDAVGFSGDRLPYSSKFSGNLSIEDEFPLAGQAAGFVGGSVGYVGNRDNTFSQSPQQARLVFPSYTKIDMRTGVRLDSWTVTLFVNNAADRRGVIGVNPLGTTFLTNYIQPRTAGLSVQKTY